MKIAFLTRSLEVGGAERQLTLLANGLAERGHEVQVGVFYPGGALAADLHGNVTVRQLRKKGRYETVRFLWRTRRWLREFRPDMAHGYLIAPNITLAVLKGASRPTRVVWGVRASHIDFKRYPRHEGWSFRMGNRLASRADLVVANSHAGARYHVDHAGYPEATMKVVPNGIDMERFQPDREAGVRFRKTWQIPEGATLIGMVGRIDPMKGYETFLEAAAGANHHFACIGSGPADYCSSMQHRADQLGLGERLTWIPSQDDMKAVYAALNLLTSSSSGEGFPNVVAEAMACGIPCAVSDAGDSSRIVGDLGEVVPSGNPVALGEAWDRMLESPPDSEALRRSIQERYSLVRMCDATERLYQELHQQHRFGAYRS